MLRKNSYLWFVVLIMAIMIAYNTYINYTQSYLLESLQFSYDQHIKSSQRRAAEFKGRLVLLNKNLGLLIYYNDRLLKYLNEVKTKQDKKN